MNIELLLDLFTNMRALLRDDAGLDTASALECVHALLRLLAGHGQACPPRRTAIHSFVHCD